MRRLCYYIACVVLALPLLAACATVPTTNSSGEPAVQTVEAQAFGVISTYNALLAQAVTYASQPRCTDLIAVRCSDAAVVKAMQDAVRQTMPYIRELEFVVKAPVSDEARTSELIRLARDGLLVLNRQVVAAKLAGGGA